VTKFCSQCGAEVNEKAVICVKCGCSLQTSSQVGDDDVNVGLVILSVLIPMFGFIYWPVRAKDKPKEARTCGITAIITFLTVYLFGMFLVMVDMM